MVAQSIGVASCFMASIRKGTALFRAGRVFAVEEIQGPTSQVVGKCVPEMSVNKNPYNITISLTSIREVSFMRCSCVSGESGSCKHTCAVLLFVMVYSKPSEKNKSLFRKGKSIDELFNLKTTVPTFSPPNHEALGRYKIIFEKHGLTSSGILKTLIAVEPLQGSHLTRPPGEDRLISSDNSTAWMNIIFNRDDNEEPKFFRSEEISAENSVFTLGQLGNPEWLLQRKFRVTASQCHKIIRAQSNQNRVKNFLPDSNRQSALSDLNSIKYGSEMEQEARKKFEEITKKTVLVCGLVVRQDASFIGASPDGLIFNDGEVQ
ncbi:hypothetical protein TCAL_15821, partial [Tigriopus californicus]